MIRKTRTALFLCGALASLGLALRADPISAAQAKSAVTTWVRNGDTMKMAFTNAVNAVETCAVPGAQGVFHVVCFTNQGFVVTSGDDGVEPIVAFSDSGVWANDTSSPLYSLLVADLSNRVARAARYSTAIAAANALRPATASSSPATARLASASASTASSSASGDSSMASDVERNRKRWNNLLNPPARLFMSNGKATSEISDMRQSALVQSKWGQSAVDGLWTTKCFNWYTPNNYPCGCVALAMAQVMRYHCWPTASVARKTVECSVDGVATKLTTMGGAYIWSYMDLEPDVNTTAGALGTKEERQAIGKLTYDCGVSVGMMYAKDGSGAYTMDVAPALRDTFGYASAISASFDEDVMRANIYAQTPVILSLRSFPAGHALVADGYGYSSGGTALTHLNFGWSGQCDLWYNLKTSVTAKNVDYYVSQMVYNIFPTNKNCGAISGCVRDSYSGKKLEGDTVAAYNSKGVLVGSTVTDDCGLYHFILPQNATYKLVVTHRPPSSNVVRTETISGVWLGKNTSVLKDISFDARYWPTITFDHNNGTGTTTVWTDRQAGSMISSLPAAPTRTGYAFSGWFYYDDTGKAVALKTTTVVPYRSSLICYASWTPITYTVAFNKNGGTGSMSSQTFKYDTYQYLRRNAFANGDRQFLGWSRSSWATAATYANGEYVRNLSALNCATVTLYAVWESQSTVFGRALDTTALTISPGWGEEATPWHVDTLDGATNGTALKSPVIANNASTSLRTTLPQSGLLTFRWKVSSQVGCDTLSFLLDGTTVTNISGAVGWETVSVYVPPDEGGHSVLWRYEKDSVTKSGSDCGWLDNVTWTPIAASQFSTVTLDRNDETGETTSFVTVNGATLPSFVAVPTRKGYTFQGYYDTPAATGGTQYYTSTMAPVRTWDKTGAQTLYARWTAKWYTLYFWSNDGAGSLTMKSYRYSDGEQALPLRTFARSGYRFLGWASTRSGIVQFDDGAVANWADYVENNASNGYSWLDLYAQWEQQSDRFGAALGNTTLIFDSDVATPWFVTSEDGATGGTALRSGAISNGEATSVSTTVSETGVLTFRWKVSSEADYDKLSVLLDGTNTLSISGTTDWNQTSLLFPDEGTHRVSWQYEKDVVISRNSDCGWLDDVTWTPVDASQFSTVALDPNGGVGEATIKALYGYTMPMPAVDTVPVRAGYAFAGYYDTPSATGGTQYYTSEMLPMRLWDKTGAQTLYARWTPNSYTVAFDANGGSGVMPEQAFTYDMEQALVANLFTCGDRRLLGWSLSPSASQATYSDSETILNLTEEDGGKVTLYAVWESLASVEKRMAREKCRLVSEDVTANADLSQTLIYNGYLHAGDETFAGTIQAKVAKAKTNRKTGVMSSSVTVAILIAGEKKISLRGTVSDDGEAVSLVAKDGRVLKFWLGANGLSGTFGDYVIDGARDVFSSKAVGDKARANEALAQWQGALAIVSDTGTFSVTISAKGKVRITGVLADGTKISTSAQMIVGETCSCIPVVVSTKSVNLAFCIWLGDDGETVEVVGLGEEVVCGRPGALADGAAFRIDAAAICELLGDDTFAAYLPDGVSVVQKGTKWIVANGARTGRVVLGKDGNVDEAKTGANPSGLKLAYKAKDGSFSGSFKAYVLYRGKPKATTVTVSGVVIDGVGYGTATIRKVGSVAVRIE